jgi:GTPase SAR1 family protein
MSDNISFSSNRSSIQKFKIVLVGDQNVGKSSIIARYIRNEFDPTKNVLATKYSQPLVSTLSAKTSQLVEKSYVSNFGIRLDKNVLKVSSLVISRTRILH